MSTDDLLQRARDLGADHAEADHHGWLHRRLHSGKEVAAALGESAPLDPDQFVALREEYAYGWSTWA